MSVKLRRGRGFRYSWLRWACCTLLTTLFAANAAASYQVSINAPRSLKTLLKKHLDLSRFSKRDDLTDEQFSFLVAATPQQARDLIKTEGYFSPVVKTKVTDTTDVADATANDNPVRWFQRKQKGKVVVLTVEPGIRTQVASVTLHFKGPMLTEDPKREQQVRSAWPLHSGDPFNQPRWDEAKTAALKVLQAHRYLAAKIVNSEARVDPRTHQADLTVIFDSGPTFTLGSMEITGLKRYPAQIIHHVNPLHEGETYNIERVLELQRQIQNTPYFASVAVDVDSDIEKPDDAPIKVKVSEYPYHAIRSGIGYTSDTGARLQGHYAYNNLFGHAWVFDLQGQLEQYQQYGSLQVSMPPDSKAYTNSFLVSYTRAEVENTVIRSLRSGATRTRSQQHNDYTYSILFYQDRLDQNDGSNTSRALVPSWTWSHRNIDDPIFPRKGNVFSLSIGLGVKGVLTDQSFTRLYGIGRQYFPIGQDDIVLLRAELGGVFTSGGSNGIPASLLFRAGGSNSVRGYSYQSIGNSVDGSVLPTKYLMTGSGEYQHWFSHNWGAAAFYDIGTATDTWAEKVFFPGIGVGARWRSPVGPVNLDLAYGLRDHSFRPYLTLGVAF